MARKKKSIQRAGRSSYERLLPLLENELSSTSVTDPSYQGTSYAVFYKDILDENFGVDSLIGCLDRVAIFNDPKDIERIYLEFPDDVELADTSGDQVTAGEVNLNTRGERPH